MRSNNTQALLESIAANVRRRRERAGITQEELAESAQLDRRYLQRVERGSINLTIDTLAALADILGVTPASLLKTAKLPRSRRADHRKSEFARSEAPGNAQSYI